MAVRRLTARRPRVAAVMSLIQSVTPKVHDLHADLKGVLDKAPTWPSSAQTLRMGLSRFCSGYRSMDVRLCTVYACFEDLI